MLICFDDALYGVLQIPHATDAWQIKGKKMAFRIVKKAKRVACATKYGFVYWEKV
jgi:hypothetical protein